MQQTRNYVLTYGLGEGVLWALWPCECEREIYALAPINQFLLSLTPVFHLAARPLSERIHGLTNLVLSLSLSLLISFSSIIYLFLKKTNKSF